jgi:hypothetical protein
MKEICNNISLKHHVMKALMKAQSHGMYRRNISNNGENKAGQPKWLESWYGNINVKIQYQPACEKQ